MMIADDPPGFDNRLVSAPDDGHETRRITLPFRPLDEALNNVPVEPCWIWDGYVAPGAVTLLAGAPKVGKSTLVFGLLSAISSGDTFLERATRRVSTLVLSEERHHTLAEKHALFELDSASVHLLMRHEAHGMPWADVVAEAVAYAKRESIEMLVIDPWDKFADLGNDGENSAGATIAAFKPLYEAMAANLAVVILAHQRKSGGEHGVAVRGSNALTGAVDVIVELSRAGGESGEAGGRVLSGTSRFASTPDKVPVSLVDDCYVVGDTSAAFSHMATTLNTVREMIGAEPVTVEDILASTGVGRATAHKAVKRLEETGHIVSEGRGVRGDPKSYRRTELVSSTAEPQQRGERRISTPHDDDRPERDIDAATSTEQGVLAEIEALAEEGVLTVLSSLTDTRGWVACRYPSHAPTHWRAPDGRVVCGTCHPPVEERP